jgi:pyridinium-3,5-biscarboxylic acid mononucleotide sulfurtransferase
LAGISTDNKLAQLKTALSDMGSILVAYSGGVDSTFLAVVAHEVLGKNMLAVLAASPVSPPLEMENARVVALEFGFRFRTIESREMEDPDFVSNPPDRCYYCKRGLFSELKQIGEAEGLAWIADGTNGDDTGDYRPGRKACNEAGIRSPLLEVGLTKAEIRRLSHEKGLPTWDRPASPCLASRIPYGTPVTEEILKRIAGGETYLHSLGLHQVRLRHHGDIARIELDPQDMHIVFKDGVRQDIVNYLKTLGYKYVTLDLAGYRTGSLNEVLNLSGKQE